jgi:hypothetical protein
MKTWSESHPATSSILKFWNGNSLPQDKTQVYPEGHSCPKGDICACSPNLSTRTGIAQFRCQIGCLQDLKTERIPDRVLEDSIEIHFRFMEMPTDLRIMASLSKK